MTAAVYRGYSAEQLDSQYNARALVPDCEKIFENWRARSADYRQRSLCVTDVPYGLSEREKLDLFIPTMTSAPVIVFIHGGYWRAMDKSDFSYLAEGLVNQGSLAAVVNYGLCPTVSIDEIVEQIRSACQWLWRNCSTYGGDPSKVHVAGHSAGGHLTAMLAATDWPSLEPDLPTNLVKSGITVSGLFELEPLRHLPLNEDLNLDESSAQQNSPVFFEPRIDLPLSVVVGGEESQEFRRQSLDFTEKWRERGANIEYLEIAGLNHFTILDRLESPDNPLSGIILSHMGLV